MRSEEMPPYLNAVLSRRPTFDRHSRKTFLSSEVPEVAESTEESQAWEELLLWTGGRRHVIFQKSRLLFHL